MQRTANRVKREGCFTLDIEQGLGKTLIRITGDLYPVTDTITRTSRRLTEFDRVEEGTISIDYITVDYTIELQKQKGIDAQRLVLRAKRTCMYREAQRDRSAALLITESFTRQKGRLRYYISHMARDRKLEVIQTLDSLNLGFESGRVQLAAKVAAGSLRK